MKIYKNVLEYLPTAKVNDKIVFLGAGTIDVDFLIESKYDVRRVVDIEESGELILKRFRSQYSFKLKSYSYNQQMALLTEEEYKALKND